MPRQYRHTVNFYVNHNKYQELIKLAQQSGWRLRRFQQDVSRRFYGSYKAFETWLNVQQKYNTTTNDVRNQEIIRLRGITERLRKSGGAESTFYSPAGQRLFRLLLEQGISKRLTNLTPEETFEYEPSLQQDEAHREWRGVAAINQLRATTKIWERGGSGPRGQGYFRLRWTDLTLFDGVVQLAEHVQRVCMLRAQDISKEIVAYMKRNALWQNHTWRARTGLYARVYQTRTGITISLGYSVFYGVYLEFSNEGRYSIVTPSLLTWEPRVMKFLTAGFLRREG